MRPASRRSIAFAVLLLLGGARPAEADSRQQVAVACKFGAGLVSSLAIGTLIDTRPIDPAWARFLPDEEVIKEWRARGATNLFTTCPGLKEQLPKGVRFATSEDYAD